jgi:glycosyltransferase involved in cell wall biosynthesis
MTPHIVLDLSRLMWRAARFAPTGIDRVELAYARHLIATARDRLSFTGWWGRLTLLPVHDAMAMVAALDRMWSGQAVDPEARSAVQALVWKLRRHALTRGEAPLHRHLRGLDRPNVYLLVSHYRLHRPDAIERLKRHCGTRVVMLIHDLIPIQHPEHVPNWQARRHPRRMNVVARVADGIIVNSAGTGDALRRYLARHDVTSPIVIAPLGIDLKPTPGPRPEPAQKPYFTYVATVEPRKNHAVLVAAWRELRDALGDATPKLVLIGRHGFKSREILAAMRQAPWMRDLVEEQTQLSDAEVTRRVGGACASLLCSVAEGYGLPVAEALSLGVPVLCSDIAELREVGGDVPVYLNPRDPGQWARTIADYVRPGSAARQAQLERLKHWSAPSWQAHFRIAMPLIDSMGQSAPRDAMVRAAVAQRRSAAQPS